jgi:hypothetical protein
MPPQCVRNDANDGPLDARGDDDGAAGVLMDTPARRSLPFHLALRPVSGKGLGVGTIRQQVRGGGHGQGRQGPAVSPPNGGPAH